MQAWISRRIPRGRHGQPEDVARLVGSLFAEDNSFLTGETIYLDGGQGMYLVTSKLFHSLESRRHWSEDERLLIDQVRRLADEVIAPNAAEIDKHGAFPWANVKAINELGLNAIFVPEAYGGAPMRYRAYLEVVKIIAAACASTGIIYATNFHAHEAAHRPRQRGAEAALVAAAGRGRARLRWRSPSRAPGPTPRA